jgi:hypothetical protein
MVLPVDDQDDQEKWSSVLMTKVTCLKLNQWNLSTVGRILVKMQGNCR